MRSSSQKVSLLGLSTAVALILAYVEVLLPPLFSAIPGIKLGLPNIAIIFLLYQFGIAHAASVSFVRVLAVSMLFGNPMTFAYSIAGALLSLTVMWIMKKTNLFSTVGVSVAGGVFHNVGQILMAILLLGTTELSYYLIVLAITGTISGIFVGLCGNFAIKRIKLN